MEPRFYKGTPYRSELEQSISMDEPVGGQGSRCSWSCSLNDYHQFDVFLT